MGALSTPRMSRRFLRALPQSSLSPKSPRGSLPHTLLLRPCVSSHSFVTEERRLLLHPSSRTTSSERGLRWVCTVVSTGATRLLPANVLCSVRHGTRPFLECG